MASGPRRWLEYEQTVNDRLVNDTLHYPIDERSNTVRPAHRPERRPVWPQRVVWLPIDRTRTYGGVTAAIRAAFDIETPDNRAPLLLHPQPPDAHRQLAALHGAAVLEDVRVTPTASYRSVVAWRFPRSPVGLKLSIGAIIGRVRRRLRENQIARGVIMSAIFDTIPVAHREQLGFDWFSDPVGVVETLSGHGWLLRRLPRNVASADGHSLVPMFSLVSARGDRPPLLVELIRRSGQSPESFVIDVILRPYVEAAAYLLFVQGIQVEAHPQNTLLEVDAAEQLTRRLVFRDLSDTSISIPLRIARRKPLPRFAPGFLPSGAPFPLASVATDYTCNFDRPTLFRAFDTVERYGLSGFVWTLNAALARSFSSYDAARVESTYLAMWQDAAVRYLNVKPLFRDDPKGLATDEALAYFLSHVDWKALGAHDGQTLHEGVEPFLIDRRARRRAGPVYQRVECAWGDMFLVQGLPAFFRPAF